MIWACAISKSLYSTIFSAPPPQPPAVWYPNQSECSRTEQTGIQTDSMLKKQGRWVQNRIRTWWPKKMHVAFFLHHIIFPSERRASFWRLRSARSAQNAPLVICQLQNLWNRLINSLSKLMFLKANSKILWRLTRFNKPHFPAVLVYFNFRKGLFYLCHEIIICQVHFILCVLSWAW